MSRISVVIPNYKGKKYLKNCIESVKRSTSLDLDIIIVDNGSKDGTMEEVQQSYPEINCICLDKNYGFCKAVNIGISQSKSPYIFLLNNDTIVCNGAVDALLNTMESDKRIFSVEAKMIQYHERDKIDSAGTYYNALGWAFARGKDRRISRYTKRTESFAACGGAALYRRDVFDKIGFFDESHFAYLEDIDIGYRARVHGYHNVFEPAAEILHVGSAASGSRYNEFKVRISARNNLYLLYKNMPAVQIVINFPLLFLGYMVKYLFFLRKGMGRYYISGFLEGIRNCSVQCDRLVDKKYLKNYIRIQLELWMNLFRIWR